MNTSHDSQLRSRNLLAALVIAASWGLVGCGSDDGSNDAGADTQGADLEATSSSVADASPDEAVAPAPPTTVLPSISSPTTDGTSDVEATTQIAEAEVLDEIDLDRNDLGFLLSDGEFLWASGADGVIVRIDPDDHTVEETTIGDVAIPGQLLPALDGDRIWWSALGGAAIIPVDRQTMEPGAPIPVPVQPGLVIVGPGDHLWVEQSEGPAALHPIDPEGGTVGSAVLVSEDDEMVGSVAAFGAIWAPLYDAGTVTQLSPTGEALAELDVGLGPLLVRQVPDGLWVSNAIDGTVAHIAPDDLTVTIVALDRNGPPVDAPGGVVATSDALWTRAAALDGRQALIYRIDPAADEVIGVRSLPGSLRYDLLGGMATIDDRLFVLDRPGGLLLELDTDQFTERVAPSTSSTATPPPDEAAVAQAITTLLSTDTSTEAMADGIVDGAELTDAIAGFKQFFEDNLPGQQYRGEVLTTEIEGDTAEVTFVVTVADEPLIDPIRGTLVRDGDRWLLTADSFCSLVATGGIPCPL